MTPELHLLLIYTLGQESVPYYHGGVVVQLSDYRHVPYLTGDDFESLDGAGMDSNTNADTEYCAPYGHTTATSLHAPHRFRMLLQPLHTATLVPEDALPELATDGLDSLCLVSTSYTCTFSPSPV